MSESNAVRMTVAGAGTASVELRPSGFLAIVRLRAAEATLDLALAKLREQTEATTHLLNRLGAARVEAGEPHFDDQTDHDPMTAMTRKMGRSARKMATGQPAGRRERGLNVVLTGVWSIDALSAEETLSLLDRVRFEIAEDDAPDPHDDPPAWDDPAEQVRSLMAQMHPPEADDRAPRFLFVARLGEEQRTKATAQASARARRNAEALAEASGMRLGPLSYLHGGHSPYADPRPDRMMERQRCSGLLAGSTYKLGEDESVSDKPQAAEFTITVNVSYYLEPAPA